MYEREKDNRENDQEIEKRQNHFITRNFTLFFSGGDIFSKVRIKIASEIDKNHVLKFYPSMFYYLDDGWGARAFFEYDYNFVQSCCVNNSINNAILIATPFATCCKITD